MKIEDFRSEMSDGTAKVAATVIWEDRDRPRQEIYFAAEARFADDLACEPQAFLVACLVPALRHGERRIAVDAEIGPELYDGLQNASRLIQTWSGWTAAPIEISARSTSRVSPRRIEEHAASFLSGGIDSIATLRENHLIYPIDHPHRIKDCVLADRFGYSDEPEYIDRARASVRQVADDAGVGLVIVQTNVRELDDDTTFWIYRFHGAALSSVAHALSNRFTSMTIASTFDIPNLMPLGSHPLLDPMFSSAEMQIRHHGIRWSRLAKVRLVAEWDVVLRNLNVCTARDPGVLNCGKCRKCLLTMIELLVIDKLSACSAFDADDVAPDALERISITNEFADYCYLELIKPLTDQGRLDLVNVIRRKSAEFQRYLAWESGQGWRALAKRVGEGRMAHSVANLRRLDETRDPELLARNLKRRWSSIQRGRMRGSNSA